MKETSTEVKNTKNEDEEISLVDLFAVLVRYRKLILIGTGVVTTIAIIWLFIVPLVFKSQDTKTLSATYTIRVVDVPMTAKSYLNLSTTDNYVSTFAQYKIQDLPFLAEECKKFDVFNYTGGSENQYDYNQFIKGISKKYLVIDNSILDTQFTVKCKVNENKLEEANKLMNDITAQISKQLEGTLIPKMQSLEETILEDSKDDSVKYIQAQRVEKDLRNFLKAYTSFVSVDGDPFVIPEGRGRTKMVIIIFFVALFVFIFLSFGINAIENIKKDPEASKTMSNAWNNGK